jgi:TRAP-type C4-dicarboxylate transport system substrate-binding protein
MNHRDGRDMLPEFSRREFGRLATVFGASAAIGAFTGCSSDSGGLRGKTGQNGAKQTLRFGIAGHTPAVNKVLPTGMWFFKEDLAERTDGAIEVELFGGNSVCTELDCAQKVLTGSLDGGNSSTENAAQTIPFLNALDFPYMWPSAASQYHFLYSSDGDRIVREPLREKYGLELLFSMAELRSIYLGRKWKDVDSVTKPEQVRGAKLRVTGSVMGIKALEQFGAAPVSLDWAGTLQALRSGEVDGMETSALPAAGYGMTEEMSHDVRIEFFPIFETGFISTEIMEGFSDDLRTAVLESAYETQRRIQKLVPERWENVAGVAEPPPPGTIYAESGLQVDVLDQEQLAPWRELASPESNPGPYEEWRKRLAKMGDGEDYFTRLSSLARELPTDTKVADVPSRRWWE